MTHKSNKSEQEQKTLSALINYTNAVNNASFAGTVMEALHQLFNDHDNWEDNLYQFKHASVACLQVMTRKKTSELLIGQMGEYSFERITELLHNVYEFIEMIEQPNFKTLFTIHEIMINSRTEAELVNLEDEYNRKIKALSIVKGKPVDVLTREREYLNLF